MPDFSGLSISLWVLAIGIPIILGGIILATIENRTTLIVQRPYSVVLGFMWVLSAILIVVALAFFLFSVFVVDGKLLAVLELVLIVLLAFIVAHVARS